MQKSWISRFYSQELRRAGGELHTESARAPVATGGKEDAERTDILGESGLMDVLAVVAQDSPKVFESQRVLPSL